MQNSRSLFHGLLVTTFGVLPLLADGPPGYDRGSGAITFGEPDGDRHPAACSIVVRKDPQSPWETGCSGVLISPTVVLTASHCTAVYAGIREVEIPGDGSIYQPWSPADGCAHCGDCEDLCPNYGVVFGSVVDETSVVIGATPFGHPQGRGGLLSSFNDVGVMVLATPVRDIEPACLAEENFLADIELAGHDFVNVGFGSTRVISPGEGDRSTIDVRRVSTSSYVGITPQNLLLTGDDGGTCYRDSGGPQFFDETNLVVSITVGGDNECLLTNIPQRIDISSAREFLADYVDLEGQCPSRVKFPRPEFALTSGDVLGGQEVGFDATESTTVTGSEIVAYEWSFGDGVVDVGPTTTHTYDRAGLYYARLVVRDDRGLWMAKSRAVAVLPVAEDVSPWSAEDIGETELPGGAFFQDSCLVIAGAEGTVSSREDRLHLTHQKLGGDFQLTARIDAWRPESARSRVGLMIRETADPAARHAAVLLEATSDVGLRQHVFLRRLSSFPRTTRHETYDESSVWLRLERRGNLLSGSFSLDGIQWLEPDTFEMPELADEVYAGVASSWALPEEGGPSSVATLCDLAIVPLKSEQPPTFVRGDCDGDGNACSGVSDALELLSWLFLGHAEPPCLVACDPDGNRELELADAVYGLNFCFKGTDAPVAPFPECGAGTETDVGLGCETSECERKNPTNVK